jgi:predicted DsbA family dithiol-disulfide isomerase
VKSIEVEIWSDVVCPWCYIGKRLFERALAEFEHWNDTAVLWRSFELDPEAARGYSGSLDQMLAEKYGVSLERARAMNEQVTRLAAEEGLEYRLSDAQRGNSFDAHRLIHLAKKHGLQAEAEERLMKAYFSEGLPIGDRETLVELAREVGLDEEEARSALEGNEFAKEVRADERRAAELGITAVPFFVIGGRYGVSGAQSPAVFLQVLQKAWAEADAPVTVGEG